MRLDTFLTSLPMIVGTIVMLFFATLCPPSLRWLPLTVAAIWSCGLVMLAVMAWRDQ